MIHSQKLACACGQVQLEVTGRPILSAECCCTSCREAGATIAALPGAPAVVDGKGATRFELYRKDRVHFTKGGAHLRELRLTPRSKTRRVVAGCCNTPLFLEFESGHWLSVYGTLWSEDALPRLQMRTMVMDLSDASVLPDDVPNSRRQPVSFMLKLLGAWAAMGFHSPKVPVAEELTTQSHTEAG